LLGGGVWGGGGAPGRGPPPLQIDNQAMFNLFLWREQSVAR
jgi:hypothetical protein